MYYSYFHGVKFVVLPTILNSAFPCRPLMNLGTMSEAMFATLAFPTICCWQCHFGMLVLTHVVIATISFWCLNINTFVFLFGESRYRTGTHFQLCTTKVNFVC